MNKTLAICIVMTIVAATAVGQHTHPRSRPATRPTSRPATQPAIPPASQPGEIAEKLFVRQIERAHGAVAWDAYQAVRADIRVVFRDSEMIKGTMHMDLAGGRVRIDTADGKHVLVFDGEKAWTTPADEPFQGARFHLLTWPYFMAAPFKLDDPGTKLKQESLSSLDGRLCKTARLTFDAGVGDTPDDWYLLYVDPTTDRLVGMAYIVTYGTPATEAEKEPHAIVFDQFALIQQVVLSKRWRFHDWKQEGGVTGDPIGEAVLDNIAFVTLDESLFERPEDSVEDKLPGAGN